MKKIMFNSVVFDVDSTLVTIEGLDFIASFKGKNKQIKKLTSLSMNGGLPMREAMKIKMEAISPNYQDIIRMGEQYIKSITKGAVETIAVLKKNGVKVWIVTGNFQPAVGMLAKYLGISKTRVITNRIFFDKNNNYDSFDIENPLSNNGGKALIVNKFKSKMGRTVFIGDGSTDLETKDFVDLFIGFGGVVTRPAIKNKSDVYVDGPLTSVLPHILNI